jgi:hypothetical protein
MVGRKFEAKPTSEIVRAGSIWHLIQARFRTVNKALVLECRRSHERFEVANRSNKIDRHLNEEHGRFSFGRRGRRTLAHDVEVSTGMTNRILLDTNVWNYLAEFSSAAAIRRNAKVGAAKVVVAPSTLYEALRFNHPEVRARRAELITDTAWTRLMPEAYSEAHELLNEIRRLRPRCERLSGEAAAAA